MAACSFSKVSGRGAGSRRLRPGACDIQAARQTLKCIRLVPVRTRGGCSCLVLAQCDSDDGRLRPAQIARTVTALVSYGTLSTLTEDGIALGTYVTFVLDDRGSPLLRLRADATHTANLKMDKRCTLFAHAAEKPAREVARVTLVGEVEELSTDEAADAAARHTIVYGSALGVDQPRDDDTFMRLRVDKCFYVAGLGEPRAETIEGEDYSQEEPDELRNDAARLVAMYNAERIEDVTRITACVLTVPFEHMLRAEMVWLDVRGVDVRGQSVDGEWRSGRFTFPRAALDERDALSMVTMAAQQAWEAERDYVPPVPELAAEPKA